MEHVSVLGCSPGFGDERTRLQCGNLMPYSLCHCCSCLVLPDHSSIGKITESFLKIFLYNVIIYIRNSYIAPNPTRLAQSTSQFKTRMDIKINTRNMHTPDDPTSTAERRQTCTHPGTICATQTCNAAIHGPSKHVMIAKSNKNWVLLEGLGEEVGFQL